MSSAQAEELRGSKIDKKNRGLELLLKTFRDSIDLQRLIGLNHDELKASNIDSQFLGFIQYLAINSVAMCVCKIYEDSKHHELDSIPSIIKSLPKTSNLTSKQQQKLIKFGKQYGISSKPTELKSYLKGTLGLFLGLHSEEFEMFRIYRNKIGAHKDSKKARLQLPSDIEFEAFFSFAKNFYEIVAEIIIKTVPTRFNKKTGEALIKLMETMGIENPREDIAN